MYVIETSDVSNAYNIATRAETNVYEIEHPKLHADSNLSTAQSIETKQELRNIYSSLQPSSGVVESTNSRLDR